MTNRLVSVVALGAAIAFLGCGKKEGTLPTATVTGKVTLPDGKPLPGGKITFRSTTVVHLIGSGEINADGTYEAKNVPQGACKIIIDNAYLKPSEGAAGGYKNPDPTPRPPGVKYVPIPAKYTNESSTDLTVTVASDPFTHNVELK